MKSKTEILEQVQALRDFELTEVAVKRNDDFFVDPKAKAVVITGETRIIAVVSNHYKLVQFRDVFVPAVKDMDFEGWLSNYLGKASLYVFPTGEQFKDNQDSIGIVLRNSVDTTTAIQVGFCVAHNGFTLHLPSIYKFRKVHMGEALNITQDFEGALLNLKGAWKTLVTKYKEYNIDEGIVEDICTKLRLTKQVKTDIKQTDIKNLWELFIVVLGKISQKKFKSTIHKQNKIEKICTLFYQFSVGVAV